MTETWNDSELHFCKRRLSEYEKRSLLNRSGRAIIFPGSPGTEVDELMQVGFDADKIHCLEKEQDIADELYDHYHDRVHVHWDEASEWLALVHGSFGYVHLDYTGHLHNREIAAIDHLRHHLDPIARVRITVARTRRMEDQFDFEHRFFDGLLNRWLRSFEGEFTAPAEALRQHLETTIEDTTITLAAIALCSFMFGVNPYAHMDASARAGPFVPPVEGTHRINSLRRFQYHEPYGRHSMFSVWFDLVPLPDGPIRSDPEWVQREVLQVLGMTHFALPPFNAPGLFQEYR